MEVSGKDKIKQLGNSKLSPFLGILFEDARLNNQVLRLHAKKVQKSINATIGKGQKTTPLVVEEGDEPPPKKFKDDGS